MENIIVGITGLVTLFFVYHLLTKNEKTLKEEMAANRKEAAESEKRVREELASLFKGFGDPVERRMTELASAQNNNFDGFSTKLGELIDKNEAKIEKVREAVEKKLEGIQKDNSEKLESMRQTVDEKLHATLEKRLGESFKIVSDRLEQVHKGLGEMQTLAIGVGDLKKVLTNVKTRGIFGEMQLGNLLEQILVSEQYDKDIPTKKGSRDRVSPVPYEKPYQAASCRGFLTPIGSLNNVRIVSNARRKAPLVSSLSGTRLNS